MREAMPFGVALVLIVMVLDHGAPTDVTLTQDPKRFHSTLPLTKKANPGIHTEHMERVVRGCTMAHAGE